MTTMNGAKHDVEDILASIRTSIADRAPMFESEKREVRVAALRGRSAIAEEAADFELPAIFKNPAQAASVRPNLLGRLSEALASSGPQERDRSRTVIPFEPAHGRMLEPPPMARSEPAPAPAPVKEEASFAADKIEAENDSLKRNMPTFFDTRMNRMGGMSQPPPQAAAPVQQAPLPAPSAELPQPPRLPDYTPAAEAGPNVEDAAAQLLRPILKQWLSENMPKIVEKALQTETGVNNGRVGPIRR